MHYPVQDTASFSSSAFQTYEIVPLKIIEITGVEAVDVIIIDGKIKIIESAVISVNSVSESNIIRGLLCDAHVAIVVEVEKITENTHSFYLPKALSFILCLHYLSLDVP